MTNHVALSTSVSPECLLFVQHGWADDNRAILQLGERLATDGTEVIAPNLNFLQTWLNIDPLINKVEAIAVKAVTVNPSTMIKVVGHSMGGLIWLEVLNRHLELWDRVSSLVLIASPVGGADLGRIIDPLKMGIGIAKDLGKNRKAIASTIAIRIPTLVIAGDVDGGSDGTVTVECTRFPHAKFACLAGLSHPVLRNHPLVETTIREFWSGVAIAKLIEFDEVVAMLSNVPGMTDGHFRDFPRSKPIIYLRNGGTVRAWSNPVGVNHVFVADADGQCIYAGFVGWLHSQELRQTLQEIQYIHTA